MSYIDLTEDNIYEVIQNNETVIIDFWAPWCGPCISFAPVFEKVAQQHPDITFAKINTEDEESLAAYFQIQSIPNIMVFKEQALIFNEAGAKNEESLNVFIQEMREFDVEEFKAQIQVKQEEMI